MQLIMLNNLIMVVILDEVIKRYFEHNIYGTICHGGSEIVMYMILLYIFFFSWQPSVLETCTNILSIPHINV